MAARPNVRRMMKDADSRKAGGVGGGVGGGVQSESAPKGLFLDAKALVLYLSYKTKAEVALVKGETVDPISGFRSAAITVSGLPIVTDMELHEGESLRAENIESALAVAEAGLADEKETEAFGLLKPALQGYLSRMSLEGKFNTLFLILPKPPGYRVAYDKLKGAVNGVGPKGAPITTITLQFVCSADQSKSFSISVIGQAAAPPAFRSTLHRIHELMILAGHPELIE